MNYIVHKDGQITHAYEWNDNFVNLEIPGCTTVPVNLGSKLWQDVVENPEEYIYKDGQVIPVNA